MNTKKSYSKEDKNFIFMMVFFFILMLISLFTIPSANSATSETETTPSNVTVNVVVSITMSNNLSTGILFGSKDSNTVDNNATGDGNGTGSNSGTTQYNITNDASSNVAIDICISDNANLTISGGSTTIPNSGYTYNFSNVTNFINGTQWGLPGTAITTTATVTQHTNLPAGSTTHARFYLDIPSAQASGDYNNTISLKGIQTGTAC